MADEDIGWFKISRRVRKSSVWWKSPPATFKVLMFMLDEAQALDNTCPGEVHMSPTVIAGLCNLPLADVEEAIGILSIEDEASHTREDKRTLEALPDGGGYRLVNFDRYHPEAAGRRGAAAVKRHIRAKTAARARWGNRGDDGQHAEVTSDAEVQPVQEEAGSTGPGVLPGVPRGVDAGAPAEVFGADGGAAAQEHLSGAGERGPGPRPAQAEAVQIVRGSSGEAPSGLPAAVAGGVAVPEVPPGRAPGDGGVGRESAGGVDGNAPMLQDRACEDATDACPKNENSTGLDSVAGIKPGPALSGPTVIDERSGYRVPAFEPHQFIPTKAKRTELETEAYRLTSEIAELTGANPEDVFARGSEWTNSKTNQKRTKLTAPLMSNEHLLKTVQDLRATAVEARKRRA